VDYGFVFGNIDMISYFMQGWTVLETCDRSGRIFPSFMLHKDARVSSARGTSISISGIHLHVVVAISSIGTHAKLASYFRIPGCSARSL
jgi:hypothetical protein